MLWTRTLSSVLSLSLCGQAQAVSLDLTDSSSVANALGLISQGLMDYYDGYNYGGTIGMFTAPYYWWQAGAAWNGMTDYWWIMENDTYKETIYDAMVYQVGTNWDYLPSNQSTTEGNDDQGFWGIAAMNNAERNFTNPSGSDSKGWLYLAQAVFNQMVNRWDTQHCGGGLRWQIYTWNAGYDYKNTVSSGCMFNLAARLARYTGNATYAQWAEKIFDWLVDVEFWYNISTTDMRLYDGASLTNDCADHSTGEWTYNYGLLLSGMAFLYDYYNTSAIWLERLQTLWTRAEVFFDDDDIMYEAACQNYNSCNNDQRCFKAIFSRFLGHVALFVPDLQDDIMTRINASAVAAARSCSGGTDGHTCGLNWSNTTWDGKYGLGEQMSALEVIQNSQILSKSKPLTANTGGTSEGSADAGTSSSNTENLLDESGNVSSKDLAGAVVATIVALVGIIAIGGWMVWL